MSDVNTNGEGEGPEVAADYDDSTDPARHGSCTVRLRPQGGQPMMRCTLEAGHWPETDHDWVPVA